MLKFEGDWPPPKKYPLAIFGLAVDTLLLVTTGLLGACGPLDCCCCCCCCNKVLSENVWVEFEGDVEALAAGWPAGLDWIIKVCCCGCCWATWPLGTEFALTGDELGAFRNLGEIPLYCPLAAQIRGSASCWIRLSVW